MSGTSPTPLLLVADQLAVENPTYPIRIDKTPIILATWLSFLPTVDQKADPSAMGYCCFECSDSHLGQPVCAGRTAPWTPIDDEIIRLPCRCLWRRGCLEWRLNPDGDDSDLCPGCFFPLFEREVFEFEAWFSGLEEVDIKRLGKEEGDKECDICRREYFNVFDSYEEKNEEEHCGIAVRLPCNHIFGKECLQLWFSPDDGKGNSCPKCRKELFPAWDLENYIRDDEGDEVYEERYHEESYYQHAARESDWENDGIAPPHEYQLLLEERNTILYRMQQRAQLAAQLGIVVSETRSERLNWVMGRIQLLERRRDHDH